MTEVAVATAAKIHVIDDDEAVRTSIGQLLRSLGYQVVLYASANVFLRQLGAFERGCILLDVKMPDMSGPHLQEHLVKADCALPIVFLTGHGDIQMSVRAIKTGAEDFLQKPVRKKVLMEAIERALQRYDKTFERLSEIRKRRRLLGQLTRREHDVLNLLIRGKMNKQIAYELGASERTIKEHRHNLMSKLQVRSLAELVSVAERLGLFARGNNDSAMLIRKEG